MENNYSNYDMLDKLIGNSKKAKSWTAFWIAALCLMAAAALWLAFTVSEKNKTISQQVQIILSNQQILEVKSRIIDSLTENCNNAKADIVKKCDAVISKTQNALSFIANTGNNPGETITVSPQQVQRLKEASKSIDTIKNKLYNVTMNIRNNNTRLFVQFNNTADNMQVTRLLATLKKQSDYVVAPAEYIDKNFGTVIKFYNYRNEDEEKYLKDLVAGLFKVTPDKIKITYENNVNIKTTVEVWIGTRS